MCGPSVLLVLILVSSIGTAIAATTSNPSTVKSSKSALTTARSAPKNITRKVITFRQNFENVEEECTCVAFYECGDETNTIINVPTVDGEQRCNGDQVCCRPKNPPPSPAPSSASNKCDDACICVPFYQCIDYQSLPVPQTDGENFENIANPRFRCEPPDFCCPPCNIMITDPTFKESVPVSPLPPVEQECGIKGKTSDPSESDIDSIISIGVKIVNDDENGETVFGEFPWMVALFKTDDYSTNDEVICGASLLSPFIVLTAAHCVNKIDKRSLRVRVGEYIVGSDENETLPHQDRTVIDVHIHPNFNPKRLFNDLALLSVDKPFVYDSHVNSICAPVLGTPYVENHSYDPKSCWSIGWGKGNISHKITQPKLKKVELPIVDHDECQRRLRKTRLGARFALDSSFVCAGGQKGYDSCKGDGGGPLFCTSRANHNQVIQVGIVSWGIGCGSEIPGIYASLEANSDWLTAETITMSIFRPES
ncbi:phenoloxidase-activating factor 2-like [Planococcus citri]|uniref:phenoloxidase-activating factor 2-like n=1 Tax=Planococcus citri TaxID=170843 RepID=UPI0031F8DDDB